MPELQSDTRGVSDRPWVLNEVSEFYREDPRTTRRRIERGELHPFRLPGSRRLLFDPEEVRGLLAPSTDVQA